MGVMEEIQAPINLSIGPIPPITTAVFTPKVAPSTTRYPRRQVYINLTRKVPTERLDSKSRAVRARRKPPIWDRVWQRGDFHDLSTFIHSDKISLIHHQFYHHVWSASPTEAPTQRSREACLGMDFTSGKWQGRTRDRDQISVSGGFEKTNSKYGNIIRYIK